MDIQKQREAFEAIPEIAELYAVCKKRDLTVSEREFLKGARCAWQQAQKVAVPEGFVLVPKEPTKEMYLAGTHELTQIDFRDIYDTDSIQVYKAMIESQEQVG